MTIVKPDNGNETKSDIFPWDIFKSDTFFSKTYQSISMTFKIELSQFYDESQPKQRKLNNIQHFSKTNMQV